MFKSDVRKWVVDNAKKFEGDREGFVAEICKRFNKTPKLVTDMLCKMRATGQLPAMAFTVDPHAPRSRVRVVAPVSTRGKPFRMSVDISEVKKEFDDESKIQEGIAALGTHLIKDNDFRLELGVSYERWKIVSAMPRFGNNHCELKGKKFKGVYWGDAAVIRDLKKKIDLL